MFDHREEPEVAEPEAQRSGSDTLDRESEDIEEQPVPEATRPVHYQQENKEIEENNGRLGGFGQEAARVSSQSLVNIEVDHTNHESRNRESVNDDRVLREADGN